MEGGESSTVDRERPFIVRALSGAGKSWLMCQCIQAVQDIDAVVLYRLLGTTRSSSDAFSLTKSIFSQVDKVLQRQSAEKVFTDWEAAKEFFSSSQLFMSSSKKYILFLDSIDQLDLSYGALDNLAGIFEA